MTNTPSGIGVVTKNCMCCWLLMTLKGVMGRKK